MDYFLHYLDDDMEKLLENGWKDNSWGYLHIFKISWGLKLITL